MGTSARGYSTLYMFMSSWKSCRRSKRSCSPALRTKLTLGTTRLLAIINGYSGREGLEEAGAYLQDLLRRHAGSDGGTVIRFGAMDN